MHKVNFMLEENVREELLRVIPPRQRSKLANLAIKKELLHIRRKQAIERLLALRKKTATLSSKEILDQLQRDRRRGA